MRELGTEVLAAAAKPRRRRHVVIDRRPQHRRRERLRIGERHHDGLGGVERRDVTEDDHGVDRLTRGGQRAGQRGRPGGADRGADRDELNRVALGLEGERVGQRDQDRGACDAGFAGRVPVADDDDRAPGDARPGGRDDRNLARPQRRLRGNIGVRDDEPRRTVGRHGAVQLAFHPGDETGSPALRHERLQRWRGVGGRRHRGRVGPRLGLQGEAEHDHADGHQREAGAIDARVHHLRVRG